MKMAISMLAWSLAAGVLQAQESPEKGDTQRMQTIYLANVSSANEANEIITGIRVTEDPTFRIYLDPTLNAVIVRGTPGQIAEAEKIIADLDKPKKSYRVTYTVTDSDGGKRIGVQHFNVVATSGGRTVLKQGSKVPILTGSYAQEKNSQETQYTYLDIGLNFDITVEDIGTGVRLKSKVEQSSILESKTLAGIEDPIIRQTVIESTSMTPLGKPQVLGSLDVPGSTRHLDVEVMVDLVR